MSLDRHTLLCLHSAMEGLRLGLCKFSGPSRTALIYAKHPGDPFMVVDPQGLLRGHEPRLREYYLDTDEWCQGLPHPDQVVFFDQSKAKRLGLAGLVSLGGRTRNVAYQMWFTEHHPDLCAPGPTRRWLELAMLQLSHNMSTEDVLSLDTAANMLQGMAPHAMHDFIVDERARVLGPDTRLRVSNILDAVIQISKTPEEGAWARGRLAFVEPSRLSKLHFLARFPKAERPRLDNNKHVRKMLQTVERSPLTLITDGEHVTGIAGAGPLPEASLCAQFHGRHGMLLLDGLPVCSFSDGAFQSTNRLPRLVFLEEALLEWHLEQDQRDRLYQAVSRIVASAGEHRYGCALILDPYMPPLPLSGHCLEHPLPLDSDEHMALAARLSKVDGALHIGGVRCQLQGFACLMDGAGFHGEDRARGARYNSALRFTHANPEILVVVVSSDRPVSVIQRGVDLSKPPVWPAVPSTLRSPPSLAEWLEG
jgi:hypothetical protein